VTQAPDWYSPWRASLDFDRIDYGVGGVELLQPEDVPEGQVGYSVASDGEQLVGTKAGDWRSEWVVIGFESACGDPIFASQMNPHSVFTAMHGEGSWQPRLVAPSLEVFRDCLEIFRRFAHRRNTPGELEANPPSEQEQSQFLKEIRQLTAEDADACAFWAVQIEMDPDGHNG
jgi:hypothetical protein